MPRTLVKEKDKTMSPAKEWIRAVGRRKTASARVRLAAGAGVVTVNGKPFEAYFPSALLRARILAPLASAGKADAYDISVKVAGGGVHGQADAIRHGIARSLLALNADLQKVLRAEGFLTRDPRAKERKKFGRHRARRGHQWRKR